MRRPALRRAAPTGTPPSAPADGGTSPARRSSSSPSAAASTARRPRCRAARPRASSSSGSPTGSAAATSSSTPRVLGQRLEPADEALLDPPGQRVRARASRTRRPARVARQPARQLEQRQRVAARLGDDPVADALVEHDAAPPSPAARARRRRAGRAPRARAGAEAPRPARAPRTRSRPARPAGAAPRTPASAPTPDRATARRRRRTAAGAPRPPPRAGSAPPARRGTGPAASPALSPNTISSAWRCGAGSRSSRSSSGAAQLVQARRTAAPSRTRRPTARTTVTSDADSTRYSSSAVLPIPASPRSTSDRLSPRRIAATQPVERSALRGPPAQAQRSPADPGNGLAIAAYAGAASWSGARQGVAEAHARADPELGEHLARCHSTVRGLRNSRAPISGLDRPSRASAAICALLRRELVARVDGALARPSRRSRAARGGRARRTPPCRSRRASRGRCAAARARPRAGPRGAATRRRADARGRAPAAAAYGPGDAIASRYARSAASPSLIRARTRASIPSDPVGARHARALGEPLERRREQRGVAGPRPPPRPARARRTARTRRDRARRPIARRRRASSWRPRPLWSTALA